MFKERFFVLFFAHLLLANTATAEENLACASDPVKCAVLTPLLHVEFSKRATEAISKIDLKNCKSDTWVEAKTVADTLVVIAHEGASGYAAFKEKFPTTYRTSQSAIKLGQAMNEAWNMSAAVKVEIADKALKSNCITIAEEEYRYVLARYTAPEQQGYQRRAAAGLDDIRSKKARLRALGWADVRCIKLQTDCQLSSSSRSTMTTNYGSTDVRHPDQDRSL